MYSDEELMEQVDPEWFDAMADRLSATHKQVAGFFWRLTGGWADDWRCGRDSPDPVPNPTMRWVRPSFAATVHRQWIFETRPGLLHERHDRHLRDRWYRIFCNDVPVPARHVPQGECDG